MLYAYSSGAVLNAKMGQFQTQINSYEYQVDDGAILFEPFSSVKLFYRSDVTRTHLFIRTQPTT